MDNEKIIDLLNFLVEGQKETNQRFDRIETKIDAVIELTADFTEFRTEMIEFKDQPNLKLDNIIDELSNVELITASNWKDIAKMKAAR
jgi:hypothetical protein